MEAEESYLKFLAICDTEDNAGGWQGKCTNARMSDPIFLLAAAKHY